MFRHSGAGGSLSPSPPATTYSSFSTLSPLAPPFTVDRPLHPKPNNPNPNPNPIDRPIGRSASFEFLFPSVPQSPYSHGYSPLAGMFGGRDDTMEPLLEFEGHVEFEGHGGRAAGTWSGAVLGEEVGQGKGGDGGGSSWMDPSLGYQVSSFAKGTAAESFIAHENTSDVWHENLVNPLTRKLHYGSEYLEWPHDKHPAVYGAKSTTAYNISEAPFQAPTASLDAMPYSHLSDSISVAESSDAYNSNPSYDRYIEQLDSCLTNPISYYPAKTYSTSAQVYDASSARGTSSCMDYNLSRKGYMTIRHGDPFKTNDDGADFALTLPKKPSANHTGFGIERNDENSRANYLKMNSATVIEPFPMEKRLSGHESAGSSWDHSTMAIPVCTTKFSTFSSQFGSAEPDDSVQNSSDILDHAVDSPCWKGASASRQSPFGVAETVGLHPVIVESVGTKDFDKDQKHLPTGYGYPETLSFPEQVEELLFDEDKKDSLVSCLKESSPIGTLSSIQQKHDNPFIVGSSPEKNGIGKGIQCVSISRKQEMPVTDGQSVHSAAKDNEAVNVDKKESVVSANQPPFIDGFNPLAAVKATECYTSAKDNAVDSSLSGATTASVTVESHDSFLRSGKPSFLGKDAQLLVKTMHNLSEMLLSSYYDDGMELKDHDYEIIRSVIDNLETFTLRNTKASQPRVTGFKDDDVMNPTNSHGMKGETHSINSDIHNDKFHNSVFNFGMQDPNSVNDMNQAFEKSLDNNVFEDTQTLLYKNLWIAAEVALCSMKYELQLARMKPEIENQEHQIIDFARWPQHLKKLSSANSSLLYENGAPMKTKETSSGEASIPWADAGKSNHIYHHAALQTGTSKAAEEVDASIMARLSILKGRADLRDSTSKEKQQEVHGLGYPGVQSRAEDTLPSFKWDGLENKTMVGRNTTKETCQGSTVSGMTTGRIFKLGPADGSAVKSRGSDRQKKQHSAGYDSSSSEWEHVLKEELS